MPYALASEYHKFTEAQKSLVTHIIPDDGEWSSQMIEDYMLMPIDTPEQIEAGQ